MVNKKPARQDNYINSVYTIRKKRVMLEKDLAAMYDVETRVLNQQVKRQFDKFPKSFMFQLTEAEFKT